jgi:hypothetical protein
VQASWRGKMGRRKWTSAQEHQWRVEATVVVQASFRGLMGRFEAKRHRLMQFSRSVAHAVPQQSRPQRGLEPSDVQQRGGGRSRHSRLAEQTDEVEIGSGRIAVSEIEAPNLSVNQVDVR